MISFNNIHKSFTTPEGEITILKDLHRDIQEGGFVAIMGPSGTGKTTFINLIGGLVTPEKGDIFVGSTAINKLTSDEKTVFRGKHISYVFQQFYLLPQLSVTENIDLPIHLNKLERRYETEEILEKVGLAGRGNSYPTTLSGGEQQRVALARAFAAKTPILLADEPTGNLDQKTARNIMDLMTSLHQEAKNTIIMITHDSHIAEYAQTTYYFENAGLAVT